MGSLEQTIAATRSALGRGDLLTAQTAARELARLGGRSFEAQLTLGDVLMRVRMPLEAHAAFAAASRLRPLSAEARLKSGVALLMLHKPDEAEADFRRAVALKPDDAESWLALAKSLHAQRRLDEATDAGHEAFQRAPDRQETRQFLGTVLGDAGRLHDAIEHLRAAADNPVFNPAAASNYLMALNSIDQDPVWLRDEHARRMDAVRQRLGEAATRPPAWTNTPDPHRRLTVGILSPDLHNHVCMRFMLPLIEGMDRGRIRLAAYAHLSRVDALTHAVKGRFDLWRNITGFSGPQVAKQARADGVDIMIECAGHTYGSRLDAVAWRCAPVQCSWLGYPNTTGMWAVDWRIVDAVSDPPGRSEEHCTERLLRVSPCAWCYRPPEHMPEVAPSPVTETGTFTFGSFNNLTKVTPDVCAAWGAILGQSPRARLILKDRWVNSPRSIGHVIEAIEAGGARREQIEVIGFMPPAEFLATYGRVDLQLDTFPYNGTTTTCESLWLGVPVLTLEGTRHAARVGASLLTAAGLKEFIAPSIDAYIKMAAGLARDPSRLVDLRPHLRPMVASSPLRDEALYCRSFESALRSAWSEWCATQAGGA